MGEIEDRQELMRIAREMINLGHELRAELKGFTQKGDLVINKLIETADRMLPAVMDEREAQRGSKKKKDVVYAAHGTITHEEPTLIEVPLKRKCSICGEPGHRKTTCPKADKAYKAQRKKGK